MASWVPSVVSGAFPCPHSGSVVRGEARGVPDRTLYELKAGTAHEPGAGADKGLSHPPRLAYTLNGTAYWWGRLA